MVFVLVCIQIKFCLFELTYLRERHAIVLKKLVVSVFNLLLCLLIAITVHCLFVFHISYFIPQNGVVLYTRLNLTLI